MLEIKIYEDHDKIFEYYVKNGKQVLHGRYYTKKTKCEKIYEHNKFVVCRYWYGTGNKKCIGYVQNKQWKGKFIEWGIKGNITRMYIRNGSNIGKEVYINETYDLMQIMNMPRLKVE